MTHQVDDQLAGILATGDFYYEPLGDGRYRSTIHAQGAWNPHEQHMAPATGVLTHELLNFQPREGMRMARLSLEIYGLIHAGEFEVKTRMLRPGRTIELVEAEMLTNGRTSIVARAWRLATGDTSAVSGTEDAPIPGPQDCQPYLGAQVWPGGYIRGLEMRTTPEHRAGKGIVWLRNPFSMINGVDCTDMERLLGMVDTANGVAPRSEPGPNNWMFPNVDLQVHMYREPVGEWLGLEAQQSYGTDGIGLTSAVLHDIHGPFGRSEQILTVRPL
ncbi:thioesterase family protein [Glutamicibacter sp. MNS18]|uniref:thioesterase family protein n=1 Tax=Glutamicibacter sp. MNS18 TaxID=2989817 RepID=UPI002235A5E1|nr:thioesterase family protein [Glutamicibacter sp. MNS18]MCW4464718.1 thioesterase family protein [Glutamicibacter sp. MNS18]